MTGEAALKELVESGWFKRRADGWCYAVRVPARADLDRFVSLVKTIGAYSVGIDGKPAPIQVTRGGDSADGLFWKVR